MTPAERLDFQVRARDALKAAAEAEAEAWAEQTEARAAEAEARAEQAKVEAERAKAEAERAKAEAEQAKAQALGVGVLAVLQARGLAVSDTARERVLSERDGARLARWLEKAIVAASVEEALADSG